MADNEKNEKTAVEKEKVKTVKKKTADVKKEVKTENKKVEEKVSEKEQEVKKEVKTAPKVEKEDTYDFKAERVTPKNKRKNNNIVIILIISILLSFVCGMLGAYLVSKTVSVESVVKNITTSELVENSISSSVDKVYNSTVMVVTSLDGKDVSTGTGFIYKINGNKTYIITNNHVIADGDTVKVEFNDSDKKIDATIVGGDKYADIAVLTIETKEGYEAVEFGDNEVLKLGDTIFTVGTPMGENYKGTVTKGILSGKDRMVDVSVSTSAAADYYMKVIQIDAAVNPGNSGGPLCDVSGKVIGVISLKIVEDRVEGMGFAIPIEDALKYANIIETGGAITRPYVGISMLDLDQEYYLWQNRIMIPEEAEDGVAVVSVEKGSPAEKAGLKKGDIIFEIDGEHTSNIAEFRYELYRHEVGETVEVTFYRKEKKMKLKITLGKNEQ